VPPLLAPNPFLLPLKLLNLKSWKHKSQNGVLGGLHPPHKKRNVLLRHNRRP
jgi:hypothetical protein